MHREEGVEEAEADDQLSDEDMIVFVNHH